MADGVNWPALGDFGAKINALPTDYYRSLQAGNEADLRDAFKNGLPVNPDGSINFDQAGRRLLQMGGAGQVGNAVSLGNLDISRQQIQNTMREQGAPNQGVPPVGTGQQQPAPQQYAPPRVPFPASQQSTPQPADNRGPVSFPSISQPNIIAQPQVPPVPDGQRMTQAQTMPGAEPGLPKDQSRAPQGETYPSKLVQPQPDRGVSPSGLDPELQAQRDQLVYRSTNPGFTKEFREANLKQLEAFDRNNRPTPEMQNYAAARRQGYSGSQQQFDLDKARNTEVEKKVGAAQGDQISDVIGLGQSAYKRLQQLDVMEDALRRGQGNITTGPFADIALKGNQVIGSLFGIYLKGVPEAEVVSKIGFGFSTQAVKEISNRPSQMEFVKGLENNPGLLLSPRGSFMMIDVLRQGAKSDAALARLARDPANRADWQGTMDKYYAEHPIMSPFDKGRPLGDADLKMLDKPQYSQEDLRRFATDAMQKGAPRDKVIQKMRELSGGQPVQ